MITKEQHKNALAGFKAMPPRVFEHNGRTAINEEQLDFIVAAEGMELEPKKEKEPAKTEPAKEATEEAPDQFAFLTPLTNKQLEEFAATQDITLTNARNRDSKIAQIRQALEARAQASGVG